ncbi:MAG TPA: hypothetical protein VK163_15400 [Opitutaceae bacterium]|nr:hypothetical protein [Opitutaceae bacterium]
MSLAPNPTDYPALLGLVEALWDAACAPARKPVRRRESDLPGYNCTLRPGSNTPLWNSLVRITLPLLRKYGTKAQLARVLGLPRQRINDFFIERTAAPDAERTLLLLVWLAQRRRGKDLG